MGNTELLSRTRHLVTLPFLGTLAAMASETFHMLGEAGIAAEAGEDALAVFSPGLANMEPLPKWALGDIGVARGTVLSGLTGRTQVNGNTLLSLQEKVALDIWYVTNRSIFLDTKILARTLLVVVFGERIPGRTEGLGRDSSEDSSSTP